MLKWMKSAIVLWSESIWVYFVIALFISIEWGEPFFTQAFWWVVAGFLSYLMNRLIAGRWHYILILVLNGILVFLLIFQNWLTAVPAGRWGVGIILSIAVLFVYVRSAVIVYQEPNRLQLLQRFEINILVYLVLAVIFSFKSWENDLFHLLFIGAIVSSLLGMILTLEGEEETKINKDVEIRKAGNPQG